MTIKELVTKAFLLRIKKEFEYETYEPQPLIKKVNFSCEGISYIFSLLAENKEENILQWQILQKIDDEWVDVIGGIFDYEEVDWN